MQEGSGKWKIFLFEKNMKEHLKEVVGVKKFGFKIQTQVKLAYLNLRKMLVQLTIFQSVLTIR